MKTVKKHFKYDVVLATPSPTSHRTAEENLGLGYLCSSLRGKGFSVLIIDGWLNGWDVKRLSKEILDNSPKLFLGFSCYRSNMDKAMEVVSLLRERGVNTPVIAGGFGPTFHTNEFLDAGFNFVVRGEAEKTILDLANFFKNKSSNLKKIGGLSYKDDGNYVNNLLEPLNEKIDEIPFPSRDTLELAIRRKTPIHILSARGCQAHCLFCSIVSFQRLAKGPQWRQRSIKNFVDEMESLYKMGARYLKVIDDSFIEPPRDEDWCERLADEIERRSLKVKLRGSIRADRVSDRIIKHLKRAGFFSYSCGIENFSETSLKRMGKLATVKQNIKALNIFKKYGIYVQAGHILFDHGTTIDELEENYKGMKKYSWTVSKGVFTEMYAADGTPLTRFLENNDNLQKDIQGLGNNKYKIIDESSRKVYLALKTWHKSHSSIYDKTIDPISAPKAVSDEDLKQIHPLCTELKKKDLKFMRKVLDLVYKGISEEKILEFTNNMIRKKHNWYDQFESKIDKLYKEMGLIYDAKVNPFIN